MPLPIESLDPTEMIACALRPAGTWLRMLSLLAFVGAAWLVAPARRVSRPVRR